MEADVFIAPTSKSLSHTQARKRATDAGRRGATLPTVTADMLARVLAGDFAPMAARSRAISDLLTAGSTAHVSCPRGTELTLDLEGRVGINDDGKLGGPGAFGNLPVARARSRRSMARAGSWRRVSPRSESPTHRRF